MLIVLMGVAASGKTTIGQALAAELGWKFIEGDDFHSRASVQKMRMGIPLGDEDRAGWLERLHRLLLELDGNGENAVMVCSALRRSYREKLASGLESAAFHFVFLRIDIELARLRMRGRRGHFMPESLIESQFSALEPPSADEALLVPAELSVREIVRLIEARLQLRRSA